MPAVANDVICFKNPATNEYTCTDFSAQFKFSSVKSTALRLLGLNVGCDWKSSSKTFTWNDKESNIITSPIDQDNNSNNNTISHVANTMGLLQFVVNDQIIPSSSVKVVLELEKGKGSTRFVNSNTNINNNSNDDSIFREVDVNDIENLTMRPSSEQLGNLGLVRGSNSIEFRLIPKDENINDEEATAIAKLNLFLYDTTDDRLVVMDIDGTMTRADVKGYISTVYMKQCDFIHPGLLDFMNYLQSTNPTTTTSRNKKNLHFLYVTSRPLGHKEQTLWFLHNAEGGSLPRGPLLMNTSSLAGALIEETVLRQSAKLKSRLLGAVTNIYSSVNGNINTAPITPFVMGFGNRQSDYIAYTNQDGANLSASQVLLIDTESKITAAGGRGAVFDQGWQDIDLRSFVASLIDTHHENV